MSSAGDLRVRVVRQGHKHLQQLRHTCRQGAAVGVVKQSEREKEGGGVRGREGE